MTYEEALAYLEACSSFGIKPGLQRMEALLGALGNPERAYKSIHITGTNGKGSVSAYVESVLVHSGLRVGRFTSPHIRSYNERITVNQGQITDQAFGELIDKVKTVTDKLLATGDMEPPTQFEILTAAAFLFFKEQAVDYGVIEVGLGGTLDSTNVITPVLSVITNVTIDHQAYCGTTVEEIAEHKAGIIKKGVPVITAAQGSALSIIKDRAKALKAPCKVFNEDFGIDSRSSLKEGQMITFSEKDGQGIMLYTSLLGIHQAVNLACAAEAIVTLMKSEDKVSGETMREGLARTQWPGRFEVKRLGGRTFILDGAHNASGAEAFQMTYVEQFGNQPKTVVMAVMKDKEAKEITSYIIGKMDRAIAVPAPTERTMDTAELAALFQGEAHEAQSVAAGLDKAMALTEDGDVICVCGSLYMLDEAYRWLGTKMG